MNRTTQIAAIAFALALSTRLGWSQPIEASKLSAVSMHEGMFFQGAQLSVDRVMELQKGLADLGEAASNLTSLDPKVEINRYQFGPIEEAARELGPDASMSDIFKKAKNIHRDIVGALFSKSFQNQVTPNADEAKRISEELAAIAFFKQWNNEYMETALVQSFTGQTGVLVAKGKMRFRDAIRRVEFFALSTGIQNDLTSGWHEQAERHLKYAADLAIESRAVRSDISTGVKATASRLTADGERAKAEIVESDGAPGNNNVTATESPTVTDFSGGIALKPAGADDVYTGSFGVFQVLNEESPVLAALGHPAVKIGGLAAAMGTIAGFHTAVLAAGAAAYTTMPRTSLVLLGIAAFFLGKLIWQALNRRLQNAYESPTQIGDK